MKKNNSGSPAKTIELCRKASLGWQCAGSLFAKHQVVIAEIPQPTNDLGYTSNDGVIHLAFWHELMEELSDNNGFFFVKGVFVHELLHQMLTNFDELTVRVERRPPEERAIYSQMANLLEDPRIEFHACKHLGHKFVDALNFTRATIYTGSEDIANIESPLGQYLTALIQLGDEGLVKGSFTFPEAEECYRKTIKAFCDGVECGDNYKVYDFVDEVFEGSRPLWQSQADAAKMISELLEKLGKNVSGGQGSGQSTDGPTPQSEASKRRKVEVKKVSREEYEKAKKNAQKGSGSAEGDITILTCDEEEKKDSENSSGSSKNDSTGKDESEDKEASKSSSVNESDTGDKNEENDGESVKASGNKSDDESDDNTDERADGNTSGDADCDSSGEENDSSQRDADAEIASILEAAMQKLSSSDIERDISDSERANRKFEPEPVDEIDPAELSSVGVPRIDGKIIDASRIPQKEYDDIKAPMSSAISSCAKKMANIFEQDVEDKTFRSGGKFCVERYATHRTSPDVFTKRREPDGKRDVAVTVLVDCSGSMYGEKISAARASCIALAEIFGKLDIPLYVLGFTADIGGSDAYHYHFIQWKNRAEDRRRLVDVQAQCNNCDGVSIRYAANILRRRGESKKLLIVISDGMPACHFYNRRNGNNDTQSAVKESKRDLDVLGIAVKMQNKELESFRHFYGDDYVAINDVNELFPVLAARIKKLVNKRT